jgi:hypothetical protein
VVQPPLECSMEQYLNRAKAYKEVFNSDNAKIVLRYLAEECGAFRSEYADDPQQMIFNAGKRQVYFHILGIIQQDPAIIHSQVQGYQEQEQLRNLMRQ